MDDIVIKTETPVHWTVNSAAIETPEYIQAKEINESLNKISAFMAKEN